MPASQYGHCELGVNYSIPPYELRANELADSKNVVPSRKGLPTGRGGQVKFNNTTLSSRVTSFHEYKSGTDRDQIVSYSTKIAVYNSGTSEFDDKITGLTDDKMFQWANFGGLSVGVNEVDAPQAWNGSSGAALTGSPPIGLTVAQWSNRLWFGGDSTNVALLSGSALNDPTDYSTSGALGAVAQTVGDSKDPITGLFGYFNLLLVGKQNTIYKISGNPATDATSIIIEPLYSRTQETDNVGFTSKWAIAQVGNDVIFLDGFDIRSLTGIQEFGDVEYNSIIPDFRDYLESIADKDLLKYTQFFHYKKEQQIWVSMPMSSTTHYVFVLDYKFKPATGVYAVYPMGEVVANVFGGVENGANHDIYFGDETGFVKQLDVGDNDDGSAIERYHTKVFSGNVPEQAALGYEDRRKSFLNSNTFIQPTQGTLTMEPSYAVDILDDEQVRDASYTAMDTQDVLTWFGSGNRRQRVPFFGVSGYTLALRWTHEKVGENFIFYPSKLNFEWKTTNIII
jgi:hypothetical protein